jgi:hypothetical protein
MTVIAWANGQVATDSMATRGSIKSKLVEKLKVRNGYVFAATGSAALFDPMIEWFIKGADPATMPKGRDSDDDATLFVFTASRCWFYRTEMPYAEEVREPCAWGVGADCVMVALDCGIDLKTAVEKTVARNVWLGGPVQVIDLVARLAA